MSVGQAYRPGRADGRFDAIVIGSGLGGLVAAALLAKAGRAVLVLERHYVAGGFTHTFRRPGYEWDVGIHYVGDVHRSRSVLRRLLDDVSDGQLAWARMTDVYDRIIVDGRPFDFVAGRERFVDALVREFPGERPALERYVELIGDVSRAAIPYFQEKALPGVLSALARPFLGRRFRGCAARTTGEVLASLTANRELRGVLAGQYGDYGLTPRESSFAIHALVAKHYLDGGNYPVGGASRFAATLVPVIERAGGRVLVSAEVAEVVIERGRATGVRLAAGETLRAPVVISDAGVLNTFGVLLAPGVRPRWAEERLRQVRPSVAHVCLYLGFEASARDLGLGQTNLWVYPGYDHDENIRRYRADPGAPLPVTYVSFPSAKDPDWDRRYPGRATMEAVGFAPYEWFERWEDDRWRRRGAEYDARKREIGDRLLENVYRHVPQVRGRVAFQELSTPLSTRHFANARRGEIYGIDHTPDRFRLSWLRPRTPIPGLYLTGQDVVTDGVGGAAMAGALAASVVLRRNVVKDVIRRAGEHR
jgi:phytoene dehydrogenase-like protein